jgi:3',5'-nucleoside bisphosphate phosphatase
LKKFRADLHVHTVLSPCAAIEMIPPLIVQEALDSGINLIAITDHNSTANIFSVMKAAQGTELMVIPGMELQTREEVHVLCLFDSMDQVKEWQKVVDNNLPPFQNDPEYFGEQFVVDETGEFIRSEERLLLTSTHLSFEDAFRKVNELGGLFIPAHVNRKAFGLFSILGMVPVDVPVEALEISRHINVSEAERQYPQSKGYPLIQNGDVHYVNEFLGSSEYYIEQPVLNEIRQAINHLNGRKLVIKGDKNL